MDEIVQQALSYIKATWNRRWYIVLVAWVISMAGWVWVYLLPDRYEASARVYVDTQSLLRPLLQGLTVNMNVEQQIKLMTRVLVSRPTLEKVARMTDLDVSAKTPEQTEDLLDDLASKITISDTGKENLYTISYQNEKPETAKKVVQALLNIFVESSLGNTRQDLASSQKFLDEQLQQYKQKLDDADNALREFKQKHIGMMPGQGGDYYSQLTDAATQLRQAQLDLQEAVNRSNQLKQQLQDQEPDLNAASAVDSPETTEIDTRIQALKSDLDKLKLKYTDLYPDVQATKRLIANLEQQKKELLAQQKKDTGGAKIQNPVYQQLTVAIAEANANVASLRARVGEFQRRYSDLRSAADKIPAVEEQYTQLTRNYQVYKQNYTELLQRRESAVMSGDVQSKTNSVDFRVIDPPRVPLSPAWPNRPLLISLVPVLGLLLGVAAAFLMSQIRRTIVDRKSLRDLTGLPLLGGVTRIETNESRRRKRKGLMAYLAAFGSLVATYGVLMMLQFVFARAG
jgi:polysaccharide chain length determinant protein (PEP-CTERM system associated)